MMLDFYVSKSYPGDDLDKEIIVAKFDNLIDSKQFAHLKSNIFPSLVWRAKRDVQVDDYFYQGGKKIN